MKTLTFILYFVAILGLIEANWRVTAQEGFSSRERPNFLGYVRSAMSQGALKMIFLRRKMEQVHGGDWICLLIHYRIGDSWRYLKYIEANKGTNNYIRCFSQ